MKKPDLRILTALVVGLYGVVSVPAHAQGTPPRVVTCDTTIAPQPLLRVQDEASTRGALLENPQLITLPNGFRAVQFSIRHARSPGPLATILNVRYTVQWTDDCGRYIQVGSRGVDGLALDPQRQEIIQASAMHPHATHATLRVYIVN